MVKTVKQSLSIPFHSNISSWTPWQSFSFIANHFLSLQQKGKNNESEAKGKNVQQADPDYTKHDCQNLRSRWRHESCASQSSDFHDIATLNVALGIIWLQDPLRLQMQHFARVCQGHSHVNDFIFCLHAFPCRTGSSCHLFKILRSLSL